MPGKADTLYFGNLQLPADEKLSTDAPAPSERRADVASSELLEKLVGGDERAAEAIFERYATRLILLARSRLSAKLAARLDPDDVVMSAYRSFFVGAKRGAFSLERSGDLWRLLVEITLHKLYRQVEHHSAARRNVRAEVNSIAAEPAMSADDSPEAAAILADEVEQLLGRLPPLARRVVELRFQGEEILDIARLVERTPRTVRRQLHLARSFASEGLGSAASRSVSSRRKEWMKTRERGDAETRGESPSGVEPIARHRAPKPGGKKAGKRNTLPSGGRTPEPPQAHPIEFDAGERLSYGDFVLKRLIGAGASGKVYRALWKCRAEPVAIKFLKKVYLADARAVSRFVREAATVMRLSHPGIVRVHGLGQTPRGGYFMVMDLATGGDLSRAAGRQAPPSDMVLPWVHEAAMAIDFANLHGVVHCDLKPSNLLLDGEGRVLVTDFGFACRPDSHDALTALAGTPAFMAPEQIDSAFGPIGPRTDVYGLGAVLFNLLTGRPPYTGSRAVDVLAEIVSGQPVISPSAIRPDLPERLAAVCQRCLAKNPRERYATAGELAEALALGEA